MGKFTTLALFALSLGGCATSTAPAPAGYGNFVAAADVAADKAIASDVASKLVVLYPPARTRFNLRQPTPDVFGARLVATLRSKGYAVAESKAVLPTAASPGVTTMAPEQSADLALAYVVDQPLDSGIYRVTVLVNSQSLSRLYQAKEGGVAAAGYWIRKE